MDAYINGKYPIYSRLQSDSKARTPFRVAFGVSVRTGRFWSVWTQIYGQFSRRANW